MDMARRRKTDRERLEAEYQRLQDTCEMTPAAFNLACIDWIADFNVERGQTGATPSKYLAAAVWVSQNLGRKSA